MDKEIIVATNRAIETLSQRYPQLSFSWEKTMRLTDIIAMLSKQYPEYAHLFGEPQESSFISPDGGFLFATNKQGQRRLVLVSEVKRQGTNDARKLEGLKKQALGNAKIENTVKFIKGNFLNNRLYVDDEILNRSCVEWLERTGNAKIHGTTRKIPAEVFQEEREQLRPLFALILAVRHIHRWFGGNR